MTVQRPTADVSIHVSALFFPLYVQPYESLQHGTQQSNNGLKLFGASVCRRVSKLNSSYDSVSHQTTNSLLDSFVKKCEGKVR